MRHSLITIAILLFNVCVEAQILYECKSSNNDTVVYVLGTCHYLPFEAKIDTVLLSNLMNASDVIFSELYVNNGDSSYRKAISIITDGLRFKNNGLLSDSVTKKEYDQILHYYKRNFGTSTKEFRWVSYYLPWVMHNRLKYSNKKFYSLDKLIYSIAKRTNNKITNLDNEQLLDNSIAFLSNKYDVKWLLKLVNEQGIGAMDDYPVIQHYLWQDTAAIGLMRRNDKDLLHQKNLVDDRNKHWFTVIEHHLGQTNFIFCGLAHVAWGELSLLNFLRTKQYSIKTIKVDIKVIP